MGEQKYLEKDQIDNHLSLLLRKGDVTVWFDKKDGTNRKMSATLREEAITPYEKKTDRVRKPRPDVLSVWDLEKNAWRSIPLDRVTGYAYEDANADS